ncbi:homocitrate synthase/isopropylmalate synthase family protein [Ammoniphilus resinae]|uniref:Isopropylmalate/homocitrate/citramalate synthase n=1 Tax=Ammoniphilus resinae TaxID=861532 RepID=A0ABS4GPH7_9BACL|nr:isopropylmalate/homocitrate/citramalate synthase [Ammoniphilus resinae]
MDRFKKATSFINHLPEVQNTLSFPPSVIISDCILRDGEQMAGLAFSLEDKVEIAKALNELGVDEIESGMPSVSEDDAEAVKRIVSLGLDSKVTALCRAIKSDIDTAYQAGVWGVSISLPIGDLQRKHKLKWPDERYLDTCLSLTNYAKEKGLYVILSPYDTTRVDLDFLAKVLTTLKSEGTVDRMRVVDTVGAAHPEAMRYLIRHIKNIYDVELEVHCHNDFGLGTANTVAAMSAGAEVASVTMNGIGERSGNTALEEVVTALDVLYGVKTNIDLSKLQEISRRIERITGVSLQAHKPVVGKNSFRHESGMVVAGLIEEPFVAEAIRPELVGQTREIVVGKGSGVVSLLHKLKELKVDETAVDGQVLLKKVKDLAIRQKRALTNEELLNLYQDVQLSQKS